MSRGYNQSVPFILVKIRDEILLNEFNDVQTEIERHGEPKSDPEGFNKLYEKLQKDRKK